MTTAVAAAERMARLETQVQGLRDDLREISDEAKLGRKELQELTQTMRQEITHYKGIVGGIALVLSGVGIVLGALKAWFLKP